MNSRYLCLNRWASIVIDTSYVDPYKLEEFGVYGKVTAQPEYTKLLAIVCLVLPIYLINQSAQSILIVDMHIILNMIGKHFVLHTVIT